MKLERLKQCTGTVAFENSKTYLLKHFLIFPTIDLSLSHSCRKILFVHESSYKGGLWCQKDQFKFSGLYLAQLPRYGNVIIVRVFVTVQLYFWTYCIMYMSHSFTDNSF